MFGQIFSKMFRDTIAELKKTNNLVDLFVSNKGPHITIDGKEYVLGLVDNKLMLESTDGERTLLDPETVSNRITGLKWSVS